MKMMLRSLHQRKIFAKNKYNELLSSNNKLLMVLLINRLLAIFMKLMFYGYLKCIFLLKKI